MNHKLPEGWSLVEYNGLTHSQALALRTMSETAPNGRVRFTFDRAKGTLEIEKPRRCYTSQTRR